MGLVNVSFVLLVFLHTGDLLSSFVGVFSYPKNALG